MKSGFIDKGGNMKHVIEYSTENAAYVEGAKMWKWAIWFVAFIVILAFF